VSDASVSNESRLVLDPGRNCWRIAKANRAAVIVDAADYFRLAREAMLAARSQIVLLGWDLDTRITLIDRESDEHADDGAPIHLGPLLSWLARRRPELRIQILAWGGEAYSFLGRGTTLARLAWWRYSRDHIDFRLDTTHPLEASHHQKILVIDNRLAFCGGIDMTGSRWDTSEHRDHEPGRRRPTTHRHYPPWHDLSMAVDGDAACAIGDLCRARWKLACDAELPDAERPDDDPWPDRLEPQFRDIEVAVARTRGKLEKVEELREIEALFVDMIASARRYLYVENQYFTSRRIGQAIARRLAEPDPPEFVIVNPREAQGWLEEEVMGTARAELFRAIKPIDHKDRLRIYYPVTEEGADIYVHAKLMIVDDVLLRVGSANLNNRSMGLDSECDLLLHPDPGNEEATRMIARVRSELMGEHLGVDSAKVARVFRETGSLIETVERLRGPGRSLRPYVPPEPDPLAEAAPLDKILDPESADAPFESIAKKGLPGLRRKASRRRR
jgi:phosphatidylserine/phosphatidylglycerophosphate/cardiolipin synthase-like enzyme